MAEPPLDPRVHLDNARVAPWIEPGCDLPALHRWASSQLDYLAACWAIVHRNGRLQARLDAAHSAAADRDAVEASALMELRALGPAGTLAPLTLGGKPYHVRLHLGALQLLEPSRTPQPSEEQCP